MKLIFIKAHCALFFMDCQYAQKLNVHLVAITLAWLLQNPIELFYADQYRSVCHVW